MNNEVAVIGGGLAGLTCAITLAKKGFRVILVEQSNYPRHKVCGEYISLEVKPLLEHLGLFPHRLNPVYIDRLSVTTCSGVALQVSLPLGAFSISRYALDHFLAVQAKALGVAIRTQESVMAIQPEAGGYRLQTKKGDSIVAKLVIGCQGKRSVLDKQMRPQMPGRSPWMGVKYHMHWAMPSNEVQLHHFPKGYCGVSQVEDGKVNVCYLVHADQLRKAGSIEQLEKQVLSRNQALSDLFTRGERLWAKPLTISNISFSPRPAVESGVLYAGDSAGLISPLCGNGMAMAIQGGYQAAILGASYLNGSISETELHQAYQRYWRNTFANRLWVGRQLQQMCWIPFLMDKLVGFGAYFPGLTQKLITLTHGKPVQPIVPEYA